MASYKIKGRLQVKGGEYIGAGTDVLAITKEEAKKHGINAKDFDTLVERGILAEGNAAAAPAAAKTPQQMSAARFMEIGKAVAKLDEGNVKHFTTDGKPEVGALKEVGITITADERDEFWAVYNAE